MYRFLVPLVAGFGLNSAGALTTFYSRRWGAKAGRLVTFAMRVLLGMPMWILGLSLAMQTPSAVLLGPHPAFETIAWLLITVGVFPMTWAIACLGPIAALPSVGDSLVQRGIYAHLRHPIYAGMILEFVGMALLRPSPEVLVACGLGLGWVVLQARLEEMDLVQRLPAYREYMAKVPPFLPRFVSGR